MAIDGVGVLAMDSGAGGMSDEAGRLVFPRPVGNIHRRYGLRNFRRR